MSVSSEARGSGGGGVWLKSGSREFFFSVGRKKFLNQNKKWRGVVGGCRGGGGKGGGGVLTIERTRGILFLGATEKFCY